MTTLDTAPISVEARGKYRIWIEFADGSQGEIDLSEHAGNGVFKAWDVDDFFDCVSIPDYPAIAWGDQIELCADALYMRLTGVTVEELMPRLRYMPY